MKHTHTNKSRKYSAAAVAFSASLALVGLLSACQQAPAQASPQAPSQASVETSSQPAAQTLPPSDVITVQTQERDTITVQSSETVKVVPDMAELRFGIFTREKTAAACQEKNNKDLTNVIDFLKEFGISQESLQTSNYGMNPVYDWNSGRTITGYEMETSLTVSDIPLDQAGTLITACVDAGINSIDRVSYLSSQYDACYQEALAKAMATARKKAQVMAEAGGCTLGKVVHVEEYSASQALRYDSYASTGAMENSARKMAADMAVEPGKVSIEASIMVEFSID